MNNPLPGRIDEELTVGALVNNDVISTTFGQSVDEPRRIMSIDTIVATHDFTAGEGGLVVGIAHSNYTAAEIEEFLEIDNWVTTDKIAQEQGGRLVRILGTFPLAVAAESLNDGMKFRTKLNWLLVSGDTLQSWAWNQSGNTLTTGGIVEIKGTAWMRRA